MLKDKTLTYISLFSCAGVGCFGFKKAGFECIATNELIERRLNVQKFNNKCRFDSGYICDDITTEETKNKIFDEIRKWEKLGNDKVDVLILMGHLRSAYAFAAADLQMNGLGLLKQRGPLAAPGGRQIYKIGAGVQHRLCPGLSPHAHGWWSPLA